MELVGLREERLVLRSVPVLGLEQAPVLGLGMQPVEWCPMVVRLGLIEAGLVVPMRDFPAWVDVENR